MGDPAAAVERQAMVERQTEGEGAGERRAEAPDPLVGQVLAERFRIVSLVARGGMGKIYKAEQIPLGRIVALKVLAPSERQEEDEHQFRKRFEREASICAKLSHSNTVRIFDFGWTADGTYFIAMEYIEGRTLHHLIKSEAPIPAARVVHVLHQICASLSEAHKTGIVHRDLKPGNVLLTAQGDDPDFVKVVDFGLVKHVADTEVTRAGHIVGSPMYMAPEQVAGKESVDHRVDIYALGMIAYGALVNKKPFERDTPLQVLMARMSSKPPPMSVLVPDVKVPSSLEWVVMTCLETDRDDRFASMHEVRRALKVVEAEIRGEPHGPYTMSLNAGRVVLPPDFSDEVSASLSRSRTQPIMVGVDAPSTSSTMSTSASVSLLAIGFVVALGGVSILGLVVAAWMTWGNSQVELPVDAAVTAPASVVAPVPEVVAPPVAPVPEPVVAPVEPEVVEAVVPPAPKPVVKKPPPKPKPVAKTPPPVPQTTEPVVAPTPPPEVKEDKWKDESDIRNPFGK